ncbi:MAG: hypothetical protein IJX89_05215 [Alphaproteobacteria bacterium]|nr:hypothetical protein [Alphaproteobacteria bacterium]
MKIKCDFCKTEYNTDGVPSATVKCAICGHVWTVVRPARRNTWLKFFASLCALFAAIVFAVAVVWVDKNNAQRRRPLVATVTSAETTTDESGITHLVVSGEILNQSDEIYGVPDLFIVLQDNDGRVVSQQKFMPSATLLDAGASVHFNHVLNMPSVAVKKISAVLADVQEPKDSKK